MNEKNEFYRFEIFVTSSLLEGKDSRRIVGAAYLRDGQRIYTIRLWMFPEPKFYLMPDQKDSSRMLIFTRELKRNPNVGTGKYFWNLIGAGSVDVAKEVIRLQFDLLDKPLYMSIFPSRAYEPESASLAIADAS